MENWQKLDSETLAANFIALSDDLSYARTFYPGSEVEKYLNHLISHYQNSIHTTQREYRGSLWNFWTIQVPLFVYRERRTLWFAFFFFLLASAIGAFSAAHEDSFVRLILGDAYVDQTLENIEAGTPMGIYANSGEWEMFFRITVNNIRVSFVAFAMGLLFSAGTLWILFINGVMLGAFQYFFYQHGLLLHSALSVWAHGTFEITSIVLAGGAGLVLGNSFLFPGTYSRLQSFRRGALTGIKIVAGLVPFFILAGSIESFITRYADRSPVVGLITIVLSLAGIVGYFIIYPGRVKNIMTK